MHCFEEGLYFDACKYQHITLSILRCNISKGDCSGNYWSTLLKNCNNNPILQCTSDLETRLADLDYDFRSWWILLIIRPFKSFISLKFALWAKLLCPEYGSKNMIYILISAYVSISWSFEMVTLPLLLVHLTAPDTVASCSHVPFDRLQSDYRALCLLAIDFCVALEERNLLTFCGCILWSERYWRKKSVVGDSIRGCRAPGAAPPYCPSYSWSWRWPLQNWQVASCWRSIGEFARTRPLTQAAGWGTALEGGRRVVKLDWRRLC